MPRSARLGLLARRRTSTASPRERVEDRAVALLVALAGWFYVWTSTSGPYRLVFFQTQGDYYNQLADGFLKGELYIPTKPPRGLLRLSDPYNPALNGAYQSAFHDLSLYHGHFYLSWGPTPVVTLFIPWRILHVGQLGANLAATIYCTVGLGAAAYLLVRLLRRYLPGYRSWQLLAGVFCLATCSAVPFMLRRTLQYEVAIASSYCFILLGMALLAPILLERRFGTWRAALGSLCLGLAVGGHIDTVVIGAMVLGLLLPIVWQQESPSRRRRLGLFLGPFALVLVLIGLYNEARFGSPLQYGETYQLASVNLADYPTFQLSYILPGLYYYLVAPPRFWLGFPYFLLPPPPYYPGPVPADYSPEVAGGVFAMAPICLVLPLAVYRVRRALRSELGRVVLALVTCALVIVVVLAYGLFSATERYVVDYATLLLLAALLVWIAATKGPGLLRRVGRVVGAGAIGLGAFAGLGVSMMGYNNWLQLAEPGTFAALARATSFFPQTVSAILGRPYITGVDAPVNGSVPGDYADLSLGAPLGFGLSDDPTVLTVVSGSGTPAELVATVSPVSGLSHRVTLVVRADGGRRVVPLSAGTLRVPITLSGGLNTVEVTAFQDGLHRSLDDTTLLGSLANVRVLRA